MAKIDPIVIVLVIGVVALVMAPQIFGGFGDLIGKGWDAWSNIFKGGGDGTTISMTIHYEDDTEHTFDASNGLPLYIVDPDPNLVVQWISFKAYVTLTKTGDVDAWTCRGTLKNYLKYEVGTERFHEWPNLNWDKSGTSWPDDTSKLMAERTITGNELDTIIEAEHQYDNNDKFDLVAYAEAQELTITFTDGTVETWDRSKIAATRAEWQFMWGSAGGGPAAITSVNLSINREFG